jgi:hypothetical protein
MFVLAMGGTTPRSRSRGIYGSLPAFLSACDGKIYPYRGSL